MKKIFLPFLIAIFAACQEKENKIFENDETNINQTLDHWHKAAATTNFNEYFNDMTNDAVFIGTDPTEYWTVDSFKTFCKPYFDKGKAWHFTSLKRTIYFNADHSTAWFDELLNTQMKICRGSGVMRKENDQWKIAHYVLSMTIPNINTNEVVKLKELFEQNIIDSLTKR